MKIVSFEDIKGFNIGSIEAYKWVEELLENKNETYLPPKISIKPTEKKGVFYNVMPSVIPKEDAAGVKLVTRYPNENPAINATLLLCDYHNGKPLALMDATYITALRTAAVAVHSIKLFAVKEFKTIGLIGLGNVMRATLKVLAEIMPEKIFDVKLYRYNDSHISFVEEFKEYKNYTFHINDTYEDTVKDCDVVLSAVTYLDIDICSNNCFKEGVTVLPIHTMGFTNCDLFFDKIFADDIGHVKHFKYFNRFKSVAEVSEVVLGNAKGRENSKERILVYNIGISLHDIFFAKKIYEKYCENCCDIDMKEPSEKYWF